MKKKILFSLFIVFGATILLFFSNNTVLADDEIRPAGDSTLWLQINTTINDPNFEVTGEVKYHYDITLSHNGDPVNETFSCFNFGDHDVVNSTIKFENGHATTNLIQGLNEGFMLQLPESGYQYSVQIINDTKVVSGKDESTGAYTYTDTFYYVPKEGTEVFGQNGNSKRLEFEGKVTTITFRINMHVYGDSEEFENPFSFEFKTPAWLTAKNNYTYSGSKSGILEKEDNESYQKLSISLKDGEYVIVDGIPAASVIWYNSFDEDKYIEVNGFSVRDYFFPSLFGTSSSVPYTAFTGNNSVDVSLTRWPKMLIVYKNPSGVGVELDKEFTIKIKGYLPNIADESITRPIVGEYPYELFERIIEENPTNPDRPIITNQKIDEGTVTFDEEGIANITLKPNHYIVIGKNDFSNVVDNTTFLVGSKFEIEEVDSEDYTQTIEVTDGVQNNPFIIRITNTRKFSGKLTISKEISGNILEDEEFTFNIKLTDDATDIPTEYEYTGSKEGTLTFENGMATIKLKGNGSITIEGLPLGATYEVTEENTGDSYTITTENSEGTISEETTTVKFTNTIDDEDESEEETKDDFTEETVEEVKTIEKESTDPKTGDNVIVFAIIVITSLISIAIISRK